MLEFQTKSWNDTIDVTQKCETNDVQQEAHQLVRSNETLHSRLEKQCRLQILYTFVWGELFGQTVFELFGYALQDQFCAFLYRTPYNILQTTRSNQYQFVRPTVLNKGVIWLSWFTMLPRYSTQKKVDRWLKYVVLYKIYINFFTLWILHF